MRRRTARALRPHRVLASVTLVVAMGVTVALLLLVVSQNAVSTPGQSAAKSNTPKTSTPTTANPKSVTPTTKPVGVTVPLGVYAGPGSPVAATAFSADAGAPVQYAFDYIDGTNWQSISNPMWFVQQWSGSGFQMIWGVPMLPSTGGFTLAAGATGAYSAYFSQLAYTLVDHGLANSVIMLGWDPEDATFPWAARTAAAAADYVSYWRQIVTAMRAVPDEQFEFAWDSAPDSDAVLPPALYPGNAYVNIVATDAFDVGAHGSSSSWSAIANEAFGPDWFATFAANHNKPLMIAKWGVVPTSASGGGDNATFVDQFLRWADERHLFAAVTWDYGSWAVTGGGFPRAAAMLHAVAEAGAVAPIARTVDS
jgi:hypothetical protein